MRDYRQCSKEELIRRIEELEKQVRQQQPEKQSPAMCPASDFKVKHGSEILDVLPDMLSVFDRDYNYIALASSEKTVHVGDSSENLVGKNLIDILPPDAYKPVKENFDRVLSTGEASIGYHNLYVDGKLENFENRVIPLDNHSILCICRNITQTVKAQNRLQMVISAVNNSGEEIYAVASDGSLVFANDQFIHHYNISDDVTRHKIYDIFQGKSAEGWVEYLVKMKAQGGADKHTDIHVYSNGEEHYHETSAFILKDNADQEVVWTISRDITDRLEQEKKIRELNQLMETILNNIPVYLFVKDTGNDFRYVYWNKEFERMSHIPASFAIGKTDKEVFPDRNDAEKFRKDDIQLLKDNRTVNFEEDYITAKGEKRRVHTIKTLVPLQDKQPLLIGIAWDITEQKKAEKELIEARIRAEEADKLKSAFLANMSHEIRTPLNAIVGFSKLMAETDDREERMEYIDIVDKNTDLLLQLISDILDLSKIEAGMLDFKEKPVAVGELCQSIYESFLPRIPQEIQLVYDPQEEIFTLTDSNRLAQVLTNLIHNAQKFTQAGEIRFGYEHKGGILEFYVRDTGIGIAPENLDKIFNRFMKLNNFVQGTGLGLPICQMIISNLGGKIWVTSTLNKGTEFRFTLPWRPAIIDDPHTPIVFHKPQLPANGEACILVAEDIESNFILLQTLLKEKYRLLHAYTGREALELFQKESPDLILMDIKMPELDGLSATRLIRAQSETVPIIALTAFADETDHESALEAGCNDFFVKPISLSKLKELLEKYI